MFDVIIVGAGAAGLTAAYRLAGRFTQLNILVIEKEGIPGRKLSAAGNGKCNLTNAYFKTDCYDSKEDTFIKDWIAENSYEDVVSFFEKNGILLYQNKGYYYPISNQGKQVTNLLYQRSTVRGVKYVFNQKVTALHRMHSNNKSFYKIDVTDENQKSTSFEAKYLILATGGAASPKLGGCKDGYALASMLKLKQNPIYPVLSPVYVADSFLHFAKGVRLDATVTLRGKKDFCLKESGQVQINENSLSGIVMMNLSTHINKWRQEELNECLNIDVLPEITWNELKEVFIQQKKRNPEESLAMMLSGILPNAFGSYLINKLRFDKKISMGDLTEKRMNRLTSSIKKLVFTPTGFPDYDKAQATGGGVSTQEVNVHTFESIRYKHLYITGELLDINGKCGGYNLTFAILSGITAADHIADTMCM